MRLSFSECRNSRVQYFFQFSFFLIVCVAMSSSNADEASLDLKEMGQAINKFYKLPDVKLSFADEATTSRIDQSEIEANQADPIATSDDIKRLPQAEEVVATQYQRPAAAALPQPRSIVTEVVTIPSTTLEDQSLSMTNVADGNLTPSPVSYVGLSNWRSSPSKRSDLEADLSRSIKSASSKTTPKVGYRWVPDSVSRSQTAKANSPIASQATNRRIPSSVSRGPHGKQAVRVAYDVDGAEIIESVATPVVSDTVDSVVDDGSCCGSCGGCPSLCGCDPCRCPLWFRAEYLMMWTSGSDLPSLLTTSPAGTAPSQFGLLSNPGTSTLFGNGPIGDRMRFGGRITGGWWFDQCRRIGIQGDFLALSDDDAGFRTALPNPMPLARPFVNATTGLQDSQILNMDGLADGFIDFNFSSRIYSAGPALRFNMCCSGGCDPCNPFAGELRTDGILGYRYFGFNESMSAREVLRPTGPFDVPGTQFELNDQIEVENEFHGVEFGINRIWQRSNLFYDMQLTCAIGEVTRRVTLDGSSRRFAPGLSDSTVPGGFLVPAQNIGTFSDRSYAFLPQVRANLGYCLCNGWRVYGGYNFSYLSSVYRLGDFVNANFAGQSLAAGPTITLADVPRPTRRGMFLHGVTIGLSKNF